MQANKKTLLTALVICIAASTLVATAGCQQIKSKLGIGTAITDPDPGSPEEVIQQALLAGIEKKENKGWKMFKKLLHSDQILRPNQQDNWRKMRFSRLRRQVNLYMDDASTGAFTLMEKNLVNEDMKLKIANQKSEHSTPIMLRDDNGKWKIWSSSL